MVAAADRKLRAQAVTENDKTMACYHGTMHAITCVLYIILIFKNCMA